MKKHIIYLLVIIFIVLISIVMIDMIKKNTIQEYRTVKTVDYSSFYFPSKRMPEKNAIICYFTQNACSSCIYDVKDYEEILKKSFGFNMVYYTNGVNKNNLDQLFHRIPNLRIINENPIFDYLDFPLILVTDQTGKIKSWIMTDFSTSKRTRVFMDKIANISFDP